MVRTRSQIRTRPTQNSSKTVIPKRKTNSLSKKKKTAKPKLKKQLEPATPSKKSPLKSSNKSARSAKRISSNESPTPSPNESPRTPSSNKSLRTPPSNESQRQPVSPPSQMPVPRSRSSSASSSISNSSSSMESASSTSDQSSRSPSPVSPPTSQNRPKTTPSQQSAPPKLKWSAETEKRLEAVFQEMFAKDGMKLKTDDAVKTMMKKADVKKICLQKWVVERKEKEKDVHPEHLSKRNVEKLEEVYSDLKRKWPNIPFLPTGDLKKLSKEISTNPSKISHWFESRRGRDRKNLVEVVSFAHFQRILGIIVSDDLDKIQHNMNLVRELHEKAYGDGKFELNSGIISCMVRLKDYTKEQLEKWFDETTKMKNYPNQLAKPSAPQIDAPPTSAQDEEVIEVTSKLSMDKEVSVYLEKAYQAQNFARAKRVEKISENIHEPKELIARWFIDRKYEEEMKNILDDHSHKAAESYQNSSFYSSLPDHLKSFVTKFILTEIDLKQHEKESVELRTIPEYDQVKKLIRDERKKLFDIRTSFIEEKMKKTTEEQMKILEEKYIPCKRTFLEKTIDLEISTALIKTFHDKKTRRLQQTDKNDIIFLGYFVKNKQAFATKPKPKPINGDEMGVNHRRLSQNGQRAAPRTVTQNAHGYHPGYRYPQLAENVVHPEHQRRLVGQRTLRDVVYPQRYRHQNVNTSSQNNLAHNQMGPNIQGAPRQYIAPVDRLPVRNTNQVVFVRRTIFPKPTVPNVVPVANRAGESTNQPLHGSSSLNQSPSGPITATCVLLPAQTTNRPLNRPHPLNQGLQRPFVARFVRWPEVSTKRRFHGPATLSQTPARPVYPVAPVQRVLLPNGATNNYNKWNVDQVVQWASLFLTDSTQIQLLKRENMDGSALAWLVENVPVRKHAPHQIEDLTFETFKALERNFYLVKDDFNRTNRL